jgi:hypothetical protein
MNRSASGFWILGWLAAGAALGGCGDDDADAQDTCTLAVPTEWTAPDWAANAADALALRARLDALVGDTLMRGAEVGNVVLSGPQALTDAYEAGDPSLADVTSPAFAPLLNQAFEEFVALVDAGAQDLIDPVGPTWTPGTSGGIYGLDYRGIDAGGIEVRQVVDKGLFAGAGLYAYALQLTAGPIEPGTIEALAALWGTDSNLDNQVVTDSAVYSYRMGFFSRIRAALIEAKGYAGNTRCTQKRDIAIQAFFKWWEQSMFARAVYYANAAANGRQTATSDELYADALHDLSEGLALAASFRDLADPGEGPMAGAPRQSNDQAIDTLLEAVGVDLADLNASTTGVLWTEDPSAFAAGVLTLEAQVTSMFGLTSAEIESYRNPTDG